MSDYLIHFNKNHDKRGQFTYGDGDRDGIRDDHHHYKENKSDLIDFKKKRPQNRDEYHRRVGLRDGMRYLITKNPYLHSNPFNHERDVVRDNLKNLIDYRNHPLYKSPFDVKPDKNWNQGRNATKGPKNLFDNEKRGEDWIRRSLEYSTLKEANETGDMGVGYTDNDIDTEYRTWRLSDDLELEKIRRKFKNINKNNILSSLNSIFNTNIGLASVPTTTTSPKNSGKSGPDWGKRRDRPQDRDKFKET